MNLLQHAFSRSTGVALALLMAACGGGGVGSDAATPTTPTPPTPPTATPTAAPISAPANTWTFVPIEGARCANGSATGIGVRLVPGSRELYIYLEGGGSCSTGLGCWGPTPGASNVNGYGAAEFANEEKIREYAYFDRQTGTRNPFAAMNTVMVPYCTGDGHTGTQVQNLDVNGTPRTTYFVGSINMALALDRLAATFPQLDRVWLMGTSAGAAGATFQYPQVRSKLGAPVHTLVDSAPGFFEADDAAKWALWGTVSPCTTCNSVDALRRYNRSLDAASRYAFLSFRYDPVVANGRSPQQFDAALGAVVSDMQSETNSRTFIADNSATLFGPPALHVVTTINSPAFLADAHMDFVRATVSGAGWSNVVLTPP